MAKIVTNWSRPGLGPVPVDLERLGHISGHWSRPVEEAFWRAVLDPQMLAARTAGGRLTAEAAAAFAGWLGQQVAAGRSFEYDWHGPDGRFRHPAVHLIGPCGVEVVFRRVGQGVNLKTAYFPTQLYPYRDHDPAGWAGRLAFKLVRWMVPEVEVPGLPGRVRAFREGVPLSSPWSDVTGRVAGTRRAIRFGDPPAWGFREWEPGVWVWVPGVGRPDGPPVLRLDPRR